MAKITIAMPDKNSPGFLRKMRDRPRLIAKAQALKGITSLSQLTPEQIDNLVELIVGFTTFPEDPKEAEQVVLDASANELLEMLQAALSLFTPEG